eukprot:3575820-Pyramimonas_sp.AAC.1
MEAAVVIPYFPHRKLEEEYRCRGRGPAKGPPISLYYWANLQPVGEIFRLVRCENMPALSASDSVGRRRSPLASGPMIREALRGAGLYEEVAEEQYGERLGMANRGLTLRQAAFRQLAQAARIPGSVMRASSDVHDDATALRVVDQAAAFDPTVYAEELSRSALCLVVAGRIALQGSNKLDTVELPVMKRPYYAISSLENSILPPILYGRRICLCRALPIESDETRARHGPIRRRKR